MGRYIIKPDKELDLYVEWSTTVDNPTCVASRAEMAAYLVEGQKHTSAQAEARLERADRSGSSMLDPTGCDWDDEGLIPLTHKGQRWLRRGRLGAYCLLVAVDDPEGAYLLTEPFEDQAADSAEAQLARVLKLIAHASEEDIDVLSLQALKHAIGGW